MHGPSNTTSGFKPIWIILHAETRRPDLLFTAVDNFNDWISPLSGTPPTITPNFDRLASQSDTFNTAHRMAQSCGPVTG